MGPTLVSSKLSFPRLIPSQRLMFGDSPISFSKKAKLLLKKTYLLLDYVGLERFSLPGSLLISDD